MLSSTQKNNTRLPSGVEERHGDRYVLPSVFSVRVKGIGHFASRVNSQRHHQNTYEVEAKHEPLPGGGVRFNVETVVAADEAHLNKPTITRQEFLDGIKEEAAGPYSKTDEWERQVETPSVRIEAVSRCPEDLVFVGGQGFFAACLSAFAQHLPLAISPDHIWGLISYAFAQHVDNHAEELRANFVNHEGKKRLEVTADHLRMSGGGNPDSGSPPEVWEQTVFSAFSDQIRGHIGDKIHKAIAGDFSTTTPVCRAAHELTLMSAMKHYFSYGMRTRCGIPQITLLGSEEDWVALRARAEKLGELMTPNFSSAWMPVLLPVLDEFVSSYQGQVNHGFWQSMVKLRGRGGSGACYKVSGWLQIFYPYLKGGQMNQDLRPWQQMFFTGPDPNNIPPILSSAPVDWDYYGTVYDLHFTAGIVGCTQDASDGTLTPLMGWFISHDPPNNPKERLEVILKEIQDLVKGHSEEAQAALMDKDQPWFRRVSILFLEREAIYETLKKALEERIDGARYSRVDCRAELEAEMANLEAAQNKYDTVESMIHGLLEKEK